MEAEKVDERLDELAQNHDADPDKVREKYEEKLALAQEKIKAGETVDVTEEQAAKYAVNMVRADLQTLERTGETIETPILAIGNYGIFEGWGEDNDSVLVGVGVAVPPDGESENRPAGLGVAIMSEKQGVDLGRARKLWQWGEHIRGWFNISKMTDSFQADKKTYYTLNSTSNSRVEEADFSGDLPTDDSALRQFVNENYVNNTFALQPDEDDDRMALPNAVSKGGEDFGSQWLDLRRFEGQVVDYYRRLPEDCDPSQDEQPFGKYVLTDDTIDSAEDAAADPHLTSEEDREQGRQPGLQVFVEPEMVEYGPGATIEVYGVLTRDDESGQHRLNAAGISPIFPIPIEDEEGGDADDVEQEPLGGS